MAGLSEHRRSAKLAENIFWFSVQNLDGVLTVSDITAHSKNSEHQITLEDLMASESAVLKRLAEDFQEDDSHVMSAHNSTTSGHNSSGTHTSHTSAIEEKVL